jgi:hypothetical protein
MFGFKVKFEISIWNFHGVCPPGTSGRNRFGKRLYDELIIVGSSVVKLIK